MSVCEIENAAKYFPIFQSIHAIKRPELGSSLVDMDELTIRSELPDK